MSLCSDRLVCKERETLEKVVSLCSGKLVQGTRNFGESGEFV